MNPVRATHVRKVVGWRQTSRERQHARLVEVLVQRLHERSRRVSTTTEATRTRKLTFNGDEILAFARSLKWCDKSTDSGLSAHSGALCKVTASPYESSMVCKGVQKPEASLGRLARAIAAKDDKEPRGRALRLGTAAYVEEFAELSRVTVYSGPAVENVPHPPLFFPAAVPPPERQVLRERKQV